ncbi:hypothetical protein GW17_00031051 [Ensete ventricosum]|nr:hypothetical protein GW17_00031051 [Ensete ventricosum]
MVAPACSFSSCKIPRVTLGATLPKAASAHPAFQPLMTRLLVESEEITYGLGAVCEMSREWLVERATRKPRFVDVPSVGGCRAGALGLGCSMGAPTTLGPPSSAKNVGVLDVVAEESARLGPFRVRRFARIALELDVQTWAVRHLGNSSSGRWL